MSKWADVCTLKAQAVERLGTKEQGDASHGFAMARRRCDRFVKVARA